MIHPIVNNNGDDKQTLLNQAVEARKALLEAAQVMVEALPHPRNYQTGGDYTADRVEAERRITVVRDMARAYYDEAIALADQEG